MRKQIHIKSLKKDPQGGTHWVCFFKEVLIIIIVLFVIPLNVINIFCNLLSLHSVVFFLMLKFFLDLTQIIIPVMSLRDRYQAD